MREKSERERETAQWPVSSSSIAPVCPVFRVQLNSTRTVTIHAYHGVRLANNAFGLSSGVDKHGGGGIS